MAVLTVHLIGAFRVWRDGQPVVWARPTTAAVLKVLLIRPGEVVSADELIEALWPHLSASAGAQCLRAAVSVLRRQLEPALRRGPDSRHVLQVRPGYRFDPAHAQVDVLEVDRAHQRAEQLRRQQRVAEAITAYRLALPHLRGELYADDPYAPWAQDARERWRRQQLELLEGYAACLALSGQHRAAAEVCRQAGQLDPYRESVQEQLMVSLARAGGPAEAAASYLQYRAQLERDLNTAPSARLQALNEQLLRGELPAPDRDRPASGARPTVVGRMDALATLDAHWRAALAGEGRLVAVAGEAGVGKTHLVTAALQALSAQGACVLSGRAFQRELSAPLDPVLDALDPLLEPQDRLGGGGPPRGASEAWPADAPRGPPFADLLAALIQASRPGGLVLFIDDLQWAEPTTLAFLSFAARRLHQERVLLIVTYRSEDEAQLTGWLEGAAEHRTLHVLRLPRLQAADLRDLLAGRSRLNEADRAWLAGVLQAESEGNPFFALEYLRWLTDTGVVEADAGGPLCRVFPERWTRQHEHVPMPVRALIEARVQRLPGPARTVLQLSAVLGRPVDLDLLGRAAQLPVPALVPLVDALLQAQLLSEQADQRLQCSHDKVRQVLYGGLSLPRRLVLHRQVAAALAADLHSAAERAHHLLAGQCWADALDQLLRAARQAEADQSWASALKYTSVALDAATHLPDADEPRYALLTVRERLLERMQLPDEQVSVVEAMLALATRQGHQQRRAEALVRLVTACTARSDGAGAAAARDEALRLYRRLGDQAGEARLHQELAYLGWQQGAFKAALQSGEQALQLFQALGDARACAVLTSNLAQLLLRLGRPGDALDRAEHATRLFRELGDVAGEISALSVLPGIHRQRGQLEQALQVQLQVLQLSRSVQTPQIVVARHMACAELYLALNRPEHALAQYRLAAQEALTLRDFRHQGHPFLGLATALERMGDAAGAVRVYRRAVEALELTYTVTGNQDERFALADALLLLARALDGGLAQPTEALDAVRAAEALCRDGVSDPRAAARLPRLLLDRAGLLWRLGHLDEAARTYRTAADQAGTVNDTAVQAAAVASLGVVYRDQGQFDASIRCSEQALELVRRVRDPQAEAYVLSSLAASQQALGRWAPARAALEHSLNLRRQTGDAEGVTSAERPAAAAGPA
ncbi:ATP-binding protein [Deinococcus sonorensis]|uniref:AAA family ATPase n=1 Tax=Deinococcus sonorensis KR-87 TaxID=694439 RepID=A0AAU7U642_9DEIO